MLQANIVDDYSTDVKPHQSVLPYSDSISSIAWAPPHLGRVLATTSWDGELRILSLEDSQFGPALFQKFCSKYPYPPLKCCWNDEGTQIYVGLLDGSVNVFDFGGGQGMEVGRHGSAINSLHFVTGMNAVLSAAHEPMAQIWQPHSPTPILSLNAENKIFTSAFQYPMFVAGTANEKILMLDLYSYNSKILIDSSDLGKHSQIQSIALNPKGNICGIGSNDGRTTIMSLIKNVSGLLTHKSIITFKSHKAETGGITNLYPVNSVAFNPRHEKWFMTAGSDGAITFWNFQSKSKIKTHQFAGHPVCEAKVSPCGNMLAYALGNDWHLGSGGTNMWQVKLGVHFISESQVKNK